MSSESGERGRGKKKGEEGGGRGSTKALGGHLSHHENSILRTSSNPNHLPKFWAAHPIHPITETGWGSSLRIQRDVMAPSITAPIALSSVPSTFQVWPLDSLKRELVGVSKCSFLILSAFYWSCTWVLVIALMSLLLIMAELASLHLSRELLSERGLGVKMCSESNSIILG